MTTLTDFLLARIAEDEEVARATAIPPWTSDGHYVGNHTWIAEVDGPEDGRHIARWDPARVLAECEAKRRIIDLHPEILSICQGCANESFPCRTLVTLALPYSDHPENNPAWSA